mmetsp:Transcript_22851/g.45847  ORF Transcript_22851/g.45847 Transcript_22851/m.45847 type:complete len:80 (-) Transcript_22851:195-434(-)
MLRRRQQWSVAQLFCFGGGVAKRAKNEIGVLAPSYYCTYLSSPSIMLHAFCTDSTLHPYLCSGAFAWLRMLLPLRLVFA